MKPLHTRLLAGVIFLTTDLVSKALSQALDPSSEDYWLYYAAASGLDCGVVFLLAQLEDALWVADLMIINGLAVLTHLYGGLIWWAYWPPRTYNYAVYALAAAQWLRLIMVDKNDKTPIRGSGVYKYVHRVRAVSCSLLPLHKR